MKITFKLIVRKGTFLTRKTMFTELTCLGCVWKLEWVTSIVVTIMKEGTAFFSPTNFLWTFFGFVL